MRKLKPPLLS